MRLTQRPIAVLTFACLALWAGHASACDQIRIVGSSTVVAEEFGRSTSFKTPIVESTGTGGGLKLFCAGAGLDTPDIANASRRIKSSEIELCEKNGVSKITEVKVRYDGIAIARSKESSSIDLTLKQIFLALAREVPTRERDGEEIPRIGYVRIPGTSGAPTHGSIPELIQLSFRRHPVSFEFNPDEAQERSPGCVDWTPRSRRIPIMTIEKSVKAVEVVALDMDPPVVMQETASVREVLQAMQEKRSGCALLCSEGRLSGIFTERDVLSKVVGKKGILDRAVSDLMTPDPVSVEENAPIRWAILHMHKGGFRNVPVVDTDGNVVSCVRHKDIVHYLVDYFAQHVLNLPPDPNNLPDTPEGG